MQVAWKKRERTPLERDGDSHAILFCILKKRRVVVVLEQGWEVNRDATMVENTLAVFTHQQHGPWCVKIPLAKYGSWEL